MSDQEPRELTTRQAANLAGCTVQYIRYLLKKGSIQGRQLDGWVWLVERGSLERWIEQRPKKG